MGIDINALDILESEKRNKYKFGDVCTLGRQQIHISNQFLEKNNFKVKYLDFCEDFLISNYGAKSVKSIDHSDYEGADIIMDLSEYDESKNYKFDTILDFGTSEHIFNIGNLFKNIIRFCKKGTRLIHVLPANNQCGHGFYQFSPELFLSLYSNKNGFKDTRVYLSKSNDINYFYEIKNKDIHERINLKSILDLNLIVTTSFEENSSIKFEVKQSDYEHAWKGNEHNEDKKREIEKSDFKDYARYFLQKYPKIISLISWFKIFILDSNSLTVSSKNNYLIKVRRR